MTSAYKLLNLDDFHPYQNISVEHLWQNKKCGLFLDMGLGKTAITLTFCDKILYDELDANKVLIIAPKRVVEGVWVQEAKKWSHLGRLKITRIIGHQKQREKLLREDTDIHIISRDNIAWLCGHFQGLKCPYDVLIIDESSSFKSPKSVRFKSLKMLRGTFKRVVILTGTPSPNGLIDLWPQIYMLDGGERLGKTISAYREDFFKPGQTNGAVVYNYNLQKNGEERIHARISDICLSMSAKDYLDLPERIDNFIEINFDEELQQRYDDFERDKILEFIELGLELTAVNAAGLINKLLQFANGAVYYELDGKKEYKDVHNLKLDALEEILDVDDKPVLVAYSYKHDMERILAKFQHLNPRVLKTEQDIEDWNAGKIRLMIMHPASGGHGLNLQYGGNTIVWFGLTWSLELYQQFNARLHRQGQEKGVIINHLVAHNTYDINVIKSLKNKDAVQSSLLEAVKHKIEKYTKQFNTL